MPPGKHSSVSPDTHDAVGGRAVWWTRKGALRDMSDGIESNGSVALGASLEELPAFYKALGREAHGERYIDRDGHFRSVVFTNRYTPRYTPGDPQGALHRRDGHCRSVLLQKHMEAWGTRAPTAVLSSMGLLGSVTDMQLYLCDMRCMASGSPADGGGVHLGRTAPWQHSGVRTPGRAVWWCILRRLTCSQALPDSHPPACPAQRAGLEQQPRHIFSGSAHSGSQLCIPSCPT